MNRYSVTTSQNFARRNLFNLCTSVISTTRLYNYEQTYKYYLTSEHALYYSYTYTSDLPFQRQRLDMRVNTFINEEKNYSPFFT